MALLPAALSALPASLIQESDPEVQVIPSINGTTVHIMPDGVQFLLFEDAVIDSNSTIPEIKEGTVLVSTEGIARVKASSTVEAVAFNGLFHVSRYGERITVSALTSPVLLLQSDKKMLIPAGSLWRSDGTVIPSLDGGIDLWTAARDTDPVPRSFFQEQLKTSTLLPPFSDVLPAARTSALLSPSIDLPRLPVAQQRLEQEQAEIAIGLLRSATEQRDGTAVQSLFDHDAYREAFASDYSRQAIGVLLARSAEFSPVALPLLTRLSSSSELWLLFSNHPRTNAMAWVFVEPELSKEDALLSWISLPKADFNPVAFDDIVLRRWSEYLSMGIDTLQDKHAFISLFLHHMDQVIDRMDSSNYPERAGRLVGLLTTFVEPYTAILSPQSQAFVHKWNQRDKVSILPISIPSEEVASAQLAQIKKQAEPVADYVPPAQAESQAKAVLYNAGALFTMKTQVVHTEAATVQVRDIVFSTPTRDRTFSLLIDTVRGEVHDIKEGAQEYPNTLSFEQFVAWANK